MVAGESLHDEGASDLQALAPGAAPDVIRDHLLPEDRERFDAAPARADATRDEGEMWTCLERWRGIAVLQTDRQRFRRLVRQIAERTTGVASPEDEPLDVTRAEAHI